MSNPEFYAIQADACSQAAQAAELPHQRDRFLRAQIAWQILADKKIEEQVGRDRRLAEKKSLDSEQAAQAAAQDALDALEDLDDGHLMDDLSA